MRYFQCDLLEWQKSPQPMQTTAWIEERAARKNALIEVKEYGNKLFQVTRVYTTKAFEADELAAKQQRDRHAFGSLL